MKMKKFFEDYSEVFSFLSINVGYNLGCKDYHINLDNHINTNI